MRALLRLYPRAWRDLYGEEFAGILAAQRMSPRLLLDIIGGAIDARMEPQVRANKGDVMAMSLLKRCAAGGPQLTKREELAGAGAMIGASIVFAGLSVLAKFVYRDSELAEMIGVMAFPAALVVTMPFTYLKGHSRTTKIAAVVIQLVILAALAYLPTLL